MAASNHPYLAIGVDVGGTNTDSVLLDTSKSGTDAVIAWNKTPTASNVTLGVQSTLKSLLHSSPHSAADVAAVTVGTTHFLNAIVEHDASRMEKVAVIRLASYNFSGQTPSFIDWPAGLRKLLEGHVAFVPGGCNIDGTKIADLDREAIRKQGEFIRSKGIKAVAIVGIGSPMDIEHRQEEEARDVLRQVLGDGVDIVCSRDISGPGVLARENATILNASITAFARRTMRNFLHVMAELGLSCPLYFTSNTGHLLSFTEAREFPIRIFSSGATNSIRGAAYLAGSQLPRDGAVVLDIGGTTTDAGSLLQNGYPRLASAWTDIAGIKVNLEVLQVESIGLGGGSVLHELEDGRVYVGPDSIGHEITTRSLSFSGDVATATDVVVASGVPITKANTTPNLSSETTSKGIACIKTTLETLIDRVKDSPDPCTVILVGGGSILCPKSLEGVNNIITPEYAAVANAIGAAIAQISGKAEKKVDVSEVEAAKEEVRKQALDDAKSHGGIVEAAVVTKEAVVGVPYVDRLKTVYIEVACPANHARFYQHFKQESVQVTHTGVEVEEATPVTDKPNPTSQKGSQEHSTIEEDLRTYRPTVDETGRWLLSKIDLKFLAIGCYILGCGGGGSPYNVYLQLLNLLEEGKTLSIVDISYFADDAVLAPLCGVGSPAVALERPGGNLVLHAMQTMEKEIGRKFDGALAVEVGGSNGLTPLAYGPSQYYKIPCVDGDLMGRAYPNFEKITAYVDSMDINALLPVTLSSGTGRNVVVPAGKTGVKEAEAAIRDVVVSMGSAAGSVGRETSAKEMRRYGILNSHSLAWRLGRAVSLARQQGRVSSSVPRDIIREFGGETSAKVLFYGKVVSVEHNLSATAHTTGKVVLQRLPPDEVGGGDDAAAAVAEGAAASSCSKVLVEFVNENLSVRTFEEAKGAGEYIALVPDLIFLLDMSTREAIGTPEYRYGLKVIVMAAAPHEIWTTERGIQVGGPPGFGMGAEYKPELQYFRPRSVIEEFRPAFSGN